MVPDEEGLDVPEFSCVTCNKPFALTDEVLARYPGWTPRYCRTCSPNKSGGSAAKKSKPRKRSGGRSSTIEENLTLAEVLAKYDGGPDTGLFTDGGCTPNPGPGGWGVVHVING